MAKRSKSSTSKSTSDALEILQRRFYAGRPRRLEKLDELREMKRLLARYMSCAWPRALHRLSSPRSSARLRRLFVDWKMRTTRAIPSQCCEGSGAR
jgi:hypothetical protein